MIQQVIENLETSIKLGSYSVLTGPQSNFALAAIQLVESLYHEEGQIYADPDAFMAYFNLKKYLKKPVDSLE